jgi:starch synthase (maltosyl-transferring)
MVHLDLAALGLSPDAGFTVRDELTGAEWGWGEHNYVRLDPQVEPAHILTVKDVR